MTNTNADSTFKAYDAEKAVAYAQGRGQYSGSLLQTVLSQHAATGGQFGVLLDVGCGPGNSTQVVAREFDLVIATDHSREMIAQNIGGTTKTGSDIVYRVSSAEELAEACPEYIGKVDLIIVAMAAHWFGDWWPQAEQMLKPGGSVALWTCASSYINPNSHPRAAEIQALFSHLEDVDLGPYATEGNLLSRNGYTEPRFTPKGPSWSTNIFRKDWDVNGVPSDPSGKFLDPSQERLGDLERALGTASMVTRWRIANPDKVGTEEDVVKKCFRKVKEITGWTNDTFIETAGSTHLIVAKRI